MMNADEIRNIYDAGYATRYDYAWLLRDKFSSTTESEISIIAGALRKDGTWLDVACGTGYFLSRFPTVTRAGLDLAPAMLEVARLANAGVSFYEGDFRDARDGWANKWDLVSCMWGAYSYVNSLAEIDLLVENLASWTSPLGCCFVPLCDPDFMCRVDIPRTPSPGLDSGDVVISGILWTLVERSAGKVHSNLIAPKIEYMVDLFNRYFDNVHVIEYPQDQSSRLASRKAILATAKKPAARRGPQRER